MTPDLATLLQDAPWRLTHTSYGEAWLVTASGVPLAKLEQPEVAGTLLAGANLILASPPAGLSPASLLATTVPPSPAPGENKAAGGGAPVLGTCSWTASLGGLLAREGMLVPHERNPYCFDWQPIAGPVPQADGHAEPPDAGRRSADGDPEGFGDPPPAQGLLDRLADEVLGDPLGRDLYCGFVGELEKGRR